MEKEVFKLWIDHGKRPQGESLWYTPGIMDTKDVTYEYIPIPNTTPDKTNDDREIKTLSNTSKIQAVKNEKMGMVQIVFYEAGELKIHQNLTVSRDSPGLIILKLKDGLVKKLTVSDPTRKLGKMHIDISGMDHQTIDLPKGDFAGSSIMKEF